MFMRIIFLSDDYMQQLLISSPVTPIAREKKIRVTRDEANMQHHFNRGWGDTQVVYSIDCHRQFRNGRYIGYTTPNQ